MSPSPPPNPEYQRPEPTDPAEIHFRKAWQLRKEKRFAEAAAEFRESLKHRPDKASTHFNLGLVCDQMGDGAAAMTHARRALELFEREQDPAKIRTAARFVNKLAKKYGAPPA